jgi:hypothetical protein
VRRPFRALALIVPALALVAAGCGSKAKPPPDPASIVPASAPLYATALVRPEGSLKSNTLADARALTHESEPFKGLITALIVAPPSGVTYISTKSVDSWLGERAGVFLTALHLPAISGPTSGLTLLEHALTGELFPGAGGGGGAHAEGSAEGALIVDVTNTTKAREFISSAAPGSKVRAGTYRGVPFSVTSEGRAFTLVGHFLVTGGERAMREVIDTSQGAAALAQQSNYSTLASSASTEDVLAAAYAAPAALSRTLRAVPGTGAQLLTLLRTLAPSGALGLTLAPQSHQARLDLDATSGGAAPVPSASESEQAAIAQESFQALPENSSLALRVVDFGAFAERALALLSTQEGKSLLGSLLGATHGSAGSLLSSLQPALEQLLATLERRRALVDKELLSWMGPAAIFLSGSSLAELNAGVVITPKSVAQATAALSKLPALLAGTGATVSPVALPGTETAANVTVSGVPVPIQVAVGKGKFVIGIGLSPVSAALSPSGTLGSSAAYQTAVKSLGEGIQPALMINVPALLGLTGVLGIGNSGAVGQLLPYLHSLTTVTGGSKQLGSVKRIRLLFGVG